MTDQVYFSQPTRPVFQGRSPRLPGGEFRLLRLVQHHRDPPRLPTLHHLLEKKTRLKNQDVINPIPDSKRRCVQETMPPATDAPPPPEKEYSPENGDVSNLRIWKYIVSGKPFHPLPTLYYPPPVKQAHIRPSRDALSGKSPHLDSHFQPWAQ